MKLVVGLVLFLVGINVGFVTAGLMHAAKGSMSRQKMKTRHVENE